MRASASVSHHGRDATARAVTPGAGGTYALGRGTGVCAATGRAFVPGEPIVATLCEAPEPDASGHEFARLEFSAAAWEGGARPAGLACFWRTQAQEPDHKRRLLVDDDTLLELFDRLEGDERAQRIAYRWLLCLILLRKRLLRHVQVEREGEREWWVVQRRGAADGQTPVRVLNPGIRDEDLQDLAEHLGDVMQSEL